ncbi:hypothetical protein MTO96_031578 [Rhipicephalus appendiculatus]
MEDQVLEEIGYLEGSIGKTNGKSWDVSGHLLACAFNSILSLFYGTPLAQDRRTLRELHQLMKGIGLAMAAGAQNQFLPRMLRQVLTWLPFTRNHRIAELLTKLDAAGM